MQVACRIPSALVVALGLTTHLAFAQQPPAAAEAAKPEASASDAAPAEPAAPTPDCAEQDVTICGRKHFEAGTKAFENKDYLAASAEFEAALQQRPHPVIRFNLAVSQARLGHPKRAVELLRQVKGDPLADKELLERTLRELRTTEQSLSHITLQLADPKRDKVELDGVALELANGPDIALDPGNHHVKVISGNAVVLDQVLELATGERVELRVGERSRRIDVVVVPVGPAAPVVPQPPPPAPSRPLSPVWFYAGAGATAVLTGLTIGSGIDTQRAYDAYKRDLPQLSQAEADARVKSGHSRELRTNLLLAGSVLCGAGTAVMGVWFVDFSGKRRAALGFAPGGVYVAGQY